MNLSTELDNAMHMIKEELLLEMTSQIVLENEEGSEINDISININ